MTEGVTKNMIRLKLRHSVKLYCEECANYYISEIFGTDKFHAQEFYKKGWRYENNLLLCPECVPKIESQT